MKLQYTGTTAGFASGGIMAGFGGVQGSRTED